MKLGIVRPYANAVVESGGEQAHERVPLYQGWIPQPHAQAPRPSKCHPCDLVLDFQSMSG